MGNSLPPSHPARKARRAGIHFATDATHEFLGLQPRGGMPRGEPWTPHGLHTWVAMLISRRQHDSGHVGVGPPEGCHIHGAHHTAAAGAGALGRACTGRLRQAGRGCGRGSACGRAPRAKGEGGRAGGGGEGSQGHTPDGWSAGVTAAHPGCPWPPAVASC
jgi:hypothetical protein